MEDEQRQKKLEAGKAKKAGDRVREKVEERVQPSARGSMKHDLEERKTTKQFLKNGNDKETRISQGRRKLTPFQIILLTVTRLRLDLLIQHYSHQHSECFVLTLVSTGALVRHSEIVGQSMLHQFVETFGKRVAAIVDCFEIFKERPSILQASQLDAKDVEETTCITHLRIHME
ncbi:hypothetical protein PAMP_008157 [Pampus punctatissimus]